MALGTSTRTPMSTSLFWVSQAQLSSPSADSHCRAAAAGGGDHVAGAFQHDCRLVPGADDM